MASLNNTKIHEKLRRKKSSILLIYRRGSTISVHIENFVELKNATIKRKKKW